MRMSISMPGKFWAIAMVLLMGQLSVSAKIAFAASHAESSWIDTTTAGDGITPSTCREWPVNCSKTDKITGLAWTRLLGRSQSWEEATTTCAHLQYNGQTGWRLPTKDELLEAFNHGIGKHPSDDWIPDLEMAAPYWSATVPEFNDSYAWYGGLGLEFSFYDLKEYKNRFVCVR